jgi:hypothetical protein
MDNNDVSFSQSVDWDDHAGRCLYTYFMSKGYIHTTLHKISDPWGEGGREIDVQA